MRTSQRSNGVPRPCRIQSNFQEMTVPGSNWTICRSTRSSSRERPRASPTSCGRVQDRHAELLAHILLDLTLEAVKDRVAKRTRRYHTIGAIHLGCLNMCAGELDRDALVVGSGVKTAALGSAAVVDWPTAENFGQPFERNA